MNKRKPTRLKEFDYRQNGAYFLTVCSQNRENIFADVGEGSPLPLLTPCGVITEKWILSIPEKYNDVYIDEYVIMPNHFHLLLTLPHNDGRGNPSPTLSAVMGWLKYQITREYNLKYGTVGNKILQRSYYDHIIRDIDDYKQAYTYIKNNPLRWNEDKLKK